MIKISEFSLSVCRIVLEKSLWSLKIWKCPRKVLEYGCYKFDNVSRDSETEKLPLTLNGFACFNALYSIIFTNFEAAESLFPFSFTFYCFVMPFYECNDVGNVMSRKITFQNLGHLNLWGLLWLISLTTLKSAHCKCLLDSYVRTSKNEEYVALS